MSTPVESTEVTPIPEAQPADDDGVAASVELAAPNHGDANGDGVPDAEQSAVASFPIAATGQYVAVAVDDGCALSKAAGVSQSVGAGDRGFTYPLGLIDYTARCAVGTTVNVQAYFYGAPDTDLIARKFDPVTGVYTSIEGATLTRLTIGGVAVVRVSYRVADGGPLDSDGVVNGSIVDPVGLAQPTVAKPEITRAADAPTMSAPVPVPTALALASTGTREMGPTSMTAIALIFAGLGLLLVARRRQDGEI